MQLCNTSISDFAERVRSQSLRVIFFGGGTLMQTWIPAVFRQYGIVDRAVCCLDNAETKWGTELSWPMRPLPIRRPDDLRQMELGDTVLLIVSSYFASIIDQLDAMGLPETLTCCVAPVMHITHPEPSPVWQAEPDAAPRIPKIIHYCWFGREPLPEHAKECIATWREHCPGYEIREWNEDNYDIGQNDYMREAYEAGCYGYVPDYARLDLLYRYGGIYLDVDVRLQKGLDDLRTLTGFTSFEEYPMVNFGGGSGAVAGLPILKDLMTFRAQYHFLDAKGQQNRTSCGFYETTPLEQHGLHLDGTLQEVAGLMVFPSEYFHPKSTVTGEIHTTPQTRGIHDFGWSWISEARAKEQEATHRRFRDILKRMEQTAAAREAVHV